MFCGPSEELDVAFSKNRFAFPVARRNSWVQVNPTINLDGKHHLLAAEIQDERSHRVLSAKLQTIELPAPQALPHQLFRGRRLPSKASGRRHSVSVPSLDIVHRRAWCQKQQSSSRRSSL
jgi:hypothetical protein